jgi:hypothetical protein
MYGPTIIKNDQISPRLQTKTVANSPTLWSVTMVHNILSIYKTVKAKIPYLKAPLFTSLFLMLATSTDIIFIDTTA